MASQENTRLCFVSWNVNGIKRPGKFPRVLGILNNLSADIVFIQETHVGPNCVKYFEPHCALENEDETGKQWKVFFTVHSPKSKGVAILIRNSVPFKYICHDEDCSGGYFVLFCYLYGELYTLVNVYNHKADRNVLGRLKEYLLETAEGVLVVGGDFNTVLHPCFDRSTSRPSPFRAILEEFTTSLTLKDTWSYLRPTDKGYTRYQNASLSRIDMFFLPEEKIGRRCEISVAQQSISDHHPLVLKIQFDRQTETKTPNVATRLETLTYNRDSRPGKISGAEILSVIKSLPNSDECGPDILDVNDYKIYQCPLSETLKEEYNSMIKKENVPEIFKEHDSLGDRQLFNVDYLIFSHIFANRLRVLITSSFKTRTLKLETIKDLDRMLTFRVETGQQKINWYFLNEAINKLKPILSAPKPDFRILDCILPKVQSSDELRLLQPGCPLTSAILNLALKHLEDLVFQLRQEIGHFMPTVCSYRQALFIYTKLEKCKKVKKKMNKFIAKSGLKISRTETHHTL